MTFGCLIGTIIALCELLVFIYYPISSLNLKVVSQTYIKFLILQHYCPKY